MSQEDDLTQIVGIGPTYKERLGEAGIKSFAQLAKLSAEKIAEVTETAVDIARYWKEEAKKKQG